MKKIEAIVKPYKLDDIKEALSRLGIRGMTVLEVMGYGRQRGHREIYRGAEYQVDFVRKIMIILYIHDEIVDGVIDAIRETAHTGQIGDGKIAVFDLKDIIRVRTGERGLNAI